MLADRRARHDRVAAALAALDDDALGALLADGTDGSVGVGGGTSVVDVDGVAVFAKRVPVTARELAHPGSTADLHGLPMACRYGMFPLAGPGVGAWRELAANRVVTAGVLAGEAQGFALLHHGRVLPGRPPVADEQRDVDAVVAQFGGSPAVRERLEELAAATSSLVLLSEHVPSPLLDTVPDPVAAAERVERQLGDVVAFLRRHALLHLDAHLGNLRADGDRLALVDFGLATSARFELDDDERAFVAANVDHDADYVAMRLVNWLVTTVCGVPGPTAGPPVERNAYVRRCATHGVPRDVPAPVAGVLARHAAAAARMNAFVARLHDGDLDARYAPTRR
ncbi:serine/threonine protein phosphatase [Cellulomonas iranensis]|uniref:Serine/threonine protein phosphatase n=1 Tax=Cellulomonas iranensis TaxID=76862 RepID=A0ABU0GI14_9CELL|nr:serine/threonine protein phosphatase [Cellulomonas iranensis]MDQ0425012.1 hypothetical protein [Cellulomonas iranensis]